MPKSSIVAAFASGCKDEKAHFREKATSYANWERFGEATVVVKIQNHISELTILATDIK